MSLAGSCFSPESAHRPFHHGNSKTRWNDLLGGLARRQVQADSRTHLIHRPARDTIPPLGGARVLLLSWLILTGSHSDAASLFQRNSVPSTQMRCMITSSRRASASISHFIPG